MGSNCSGNFKAAEIYDPDEEKLVELESMDPPLYVGKEQHNWKELDPASPHLSPVHHPQQHAHHQQQHAHHQQQHAHHPQHALPRPSSQTQLLPKDPQLKTAQQQYEDSLIKWDVRHHENLEKLWIRSPIVLMGLKQFQKLQSKRTEFYVDHIPVFDSPVGSQTRLLFRSKSKESFGNRHPPRSMNLIFCPSAIDSIQVKDALRWMKYFREVSPHKDSIRIFSHLYQYHILQELELQRFEWEEMSDNAISSDSVPQKLPLFTTPIMIRIVSFCNFFDIMQIRSSCRQFQSLCRKREVWKPYFDLTGLSTVADVNRIFKTLPSEEDLQQLIKLAGWKQIKNLKELPEEEFCHLDAMFQKNLKKQDADYGEHYVARPLIGGIVEG